MGINLMRDLGYDESSKEVVQAREAVHVYERLIESLVASRKECAISQVELARRMGTTQSAVSDLENLVSDARFSTLLRYTQAVGAEMEITVLTPHRALSTSRPQWVSIDVQSGPLESAQTLVRRAKEWKPVATVERLTLPLRQAA